MQTRIQKAFNIGSLTFSPCPCRTAYIPHQTSWACCFVSSMVGVLNCAVHVLFCAQQNKEKVLQCFLGFEDTHEEK